jgi:hypothetical protein
MTRQYTGRRQETGPSNRGQECPRSLRSCRPLQTLLTEQTRSTLVGSPQPRPEGAQEPSPGLGSLGDRHPGWRNKRNSTLKESRSGFIGDAPSHTQRKPPGPLQGPRNFSPSTQGVGRLGSLTLGWAPAAFQAATSTRLIEDLCGLWRWQSSLSANTPMKSWWLRRNETRSRAAQSPGTSASGIPIDTPLSN